MRVYKWPKSKEKALGVWFSIHPTKQWKHSARGLVLSYVSRCLEAQMKPSHSFLIYYLNIDISFSLYMDVCFLLLLLLGERGARERKIKICRHLWGKKRFIYVNALSLSPPRSKYQLKWTNDIDFRKASKKHSESRGLLVLLLKHVYCQFNSD